ncbi:hypothetical protein AAC387_Pa08g2535 [Persea americana]
MMDDTCSQGGAFDLLKQLEHILETDNLIDEVGFVHPSQFVALNKGLNSSCPPSVSVLESTDGNIGRDTAEDTVEQYDHNIFWNRDNKLAISTSSVLPLYGAAVHAFMSASRQYKASINLPERTDSVDESVDHRYSNCRTFLENELMRHSKALVILSCDFGSAWNSRKLIVSRKQSFSLFMGELQLSTLTLSYSPKSECAWNHRRWVIKMIAGKCDNLSEIMRKDSELVEKIAEKSKMNYRAWNHRCWLVSYMTTEQVLDELNQSRKWAELHVADNCCFHYRRRLLLWIFEESRSKEVEACFDYKIDLYLVWKEEFIWDEMLIKRYIGREALWVHRRFLSQCWIKHFMDAQSEICHHSENYIFDTLLNNELQLLHSCLSKSDNAFEDCQMHAELAASYILWISKQFPQTLESELQVKLKNLGDLKGILNKVSPEKTLLWESSMG